MTHHALPASEATRYRAGGLILAGVLTLALGWVIACWEVGGLPLGLLSLASAVAILLFTDEDGDTDTPSTNPASLLHSLTHACLLTLAVLQLA